MSGADVKPLSGPGPIAARAAEQSAAEDGAIVRSPQMDCHLSTMMLQTSHEKHKYYQGLFETISLDEPFVLVLILIPG